MSFTLDQASGTYGTCACRTDQYLTDSSTCEACGVNATTCADSSGLATSCATSYSLANGLCDCNADQYVDADGFCQDCSANCTRCNSDTECIICETTFTLHSDNMCRCANEGVDEYYASSNDTCVTIYDPDPNYFNDGFNLMTPCYDNYCDICANASSDGCSQCLPNFNLQSDYSCYCSDENYFLDTSAGACVEIIDCGDAKYNDGINNCIDCPANCSQCDENATCTECLHNNILDYPVVGRCACGDLQYQASTGECLDIETKNCLRADDITGHCTDCSDGFTLNSDYQCRCSSTQYFNSRDNVCSDCPDSCSGCRRPRKCTGCISNYVFHRERTCICEAPLVDSGTQCLTLQACSSGYYKPNPNDNICVQCDYGCAVCNDVTPICTQCQSGFTLMGGVCS